MPQILSLLDENHGNDIINRTNQWGNRMKTMTYSCLQILFVSLLNCNRSSFYPHVNHFFISVIFPLILGKYFVKLIWKLNLNEISSYAQWQCGNFGNFPPLKFFFVKLIYSITHSVEKTSYLLSRFFAKFAEKIRLNLLYKMPSQKWKLRIFAQICARIFYYI